MDWRRLLQPLFVVWSIVVTARFFGILTREIGTPFNGGSDWLWAAGWIIAGLLIVFVVASVPPKISRFLWLLPTSGIALVIALSGAWLPALLALWLIVLCAGIGAAVVRRVVGAKNNALECLICGIPIGIGVISTAVFIIGLCGHLTTPAMWTLCLIFSAITFGLWHREISSTMPRNLATTEEAIIYSVVAAIMFVYSLWAIAPEVQYDALNYHLAVPAKFLQAGGIIEIPFFHAYFARLIELFFVVCLAIGGPITVKLWIFFASVCAVAAVYTLGQCTFDKRIGLWAAALFATTPLVGWLFSTGYIDNILALMITASFIALARWEDTRADGWLYVAGLLAGVAVASKMNAAFAYLLVGPLIVLQVVTAQSQKPIQRARILGLTAIAASIFVLPTYGLTYRFTGNPVFPFLNGIFKSSKWAFTNTVMNAADYNLPRTLSWLIRFPFRLTFDSIRFGEALPRGGIGVMLLFAFPFSFFLIARTRMAVRIVIIGITGYLIALFYTMQYARYYVLVLPLVVVLGVATIWELTPKSIARGLPAIVLVIVILQPLVYSLQFWNIPERLPVALAFGLEEKDSFLHRALPGYAAAVYLNTVTDKRDRILGVGTENLRFYLSGELKTSGLNLADDPASAIEFLRADDALASSIKKLGFSHLFITRASIKASPHKYPYLESEFLSSNARIVFEDDYAIVYRFL